MVDALPRVAVEAKAFDVSFADPHGAQVVQYCSVLRIEWAVVTNAREWRLYHGFAKGPLAEKLLVAVDLLSWETDAGYDAVFEQLWLVSKEAFQTSGGPSAWLVAKQLDGVLRKSLVDASSPEIKYIRKRLADQAITATTDQLATWFKMHLDGVGPSGLSRTPSAGAPITIVPPSAAAKPADPDRTSYYRVMLGKGSAYAEECLAGGFVGTDFDIAQDLTNDLPEDWRVFNGKFIPVFLGANPGKTRVAAGLACGALWTVSKGLLIGDIVLCPNGKSQYQVGRVSGAYHYEAGGVLPHRRPVTWIATIDRSSMSEALRNSTGSIGTVSNVTGYRDEIKNLLP